MKAVRKSGGASLMEMMIAVALVFLAAPFAYRQISNLGDDLKIMADAAEIVRNAEPVRNFMRLYSDEFVPGEMNSVDIDGENVELFVVNVSGEISAFLVDKNHKDDILRAHKIANMIGVSAAVVEEDSMAYSPYGNWAIMIPGGEAGDIVYRIKAARIVDDTAKYLHRTVLLENDLSVMKRDLYMGGFSIVGAGAIAAQKLSASDLEANLIKANAVRAGSLYFADGLNLNPEKAKIPNMRVVGDVVGFRNLSADNFTSSSGSVTSDRADISKTLVVSKKLEVKSPYSRSVSGLGNVSAADVKTAYLDAETLAFMPGFGLVVSGELLYTATPPIRIGAWSFPNSGGTGPRVENLRLSNFGGKKIDAKIPDFSEILKGGWR
ncbi:MAG: hypothetical protein LBQ49_02885 [Rickettsiales bacterium]|jgi:hypothetical protein|nr:hypothetical protein [Rickettsiales bacterium]